MCKSSEFFKRATKPEWADLRENPDIIDLTDDTVRPVSDYIRWLYSSIMPFELYKAEDKDSREKKAEEAEKVFILLAEAYVFGEKIDDAKYKNAVMKTVLAAKESSEWNMGPESVNIVYKGTPSGSPLRRLISESIAHLAYDDSDKGVGWITFFDAYSKEALMDAIKAMARIRRTVGYSSDMNLLKSYLEKEN